MWLCFLRLKSKRSVHKVGNSWQVVLHDLDQVSMSRHDRANSSQEALKVLPEYQSMLMSCWKLLRYLLFCCNRLESTLKVFGL
jgi:hypothetical protein